ncbi:MAG: 6-phosphogluconolactonase [Acidiferrobacteraceae bacterium]
MVQKTAQDSRRQIYSDMESVMSGCANEIVRIARAAVRERGRFLWVLSGGSTPTPVYAEISSAHAHAIDWARVHVFWGDERCVPPEDTRSNYRNACTSLLDHVPLAASAVHRIRGEDEPTQAAAEYERVIMAVCGTHPPDALFDLVLLGLGENGHTASLFPGLAAVCETRRGVMAEYVPDETMWRVTLTPWFLNAARETIFLVSGATKASVVRRVLEGPHCPDRLPAQAVRPANGRVQWFLDRAAAAQLGMSAP